LIKFLFFDPNQSQVASNSDSTNATIWLGNAAFTLSGFDDQERNLTIVKTVFQVLILEFLACSMKQAFYLLRKQNIARA